MRLLLIPMAVLCAAAPAQADVKARFIDGQYVMSAEACGKLKALARGATRSLGTVPWSVSRDGFDQWEGSCGFKRIRETAKGKRWEVTATCEGLVPEDESTESYIFERTSPTTFSVTLTTPGAKPEDRAPKTYMRCDVPQRRR